MCEATFPLLYPSSSPHFPSKTPQVPTAHHLFQKKKKPSPFPQVPTPPKSPPYTFTFSIIKLFVIGRKRPSPPLFSLGVWILEGSNGGFDGKYKDETIWVADCGAPGGVDGDRIYITLHEQSLFPLKLTVKAAFVAQTAQLLKKERLEIHGKPSQSRKFIGGPNSHRKDRICAIPCIDNAFQPSHLRLATADGTLRQRNISYGTAAYGPIGSGCSRRQAPRIMEKRFPLLKV